MAEYSQLILTKDTATFKGEGLPEISIDLGGEVTFKDTGTLAGVEILGKTHHLIFRPLRGGKQEVLVLKSEEDEERVDSQRIPITVQLIVDAKDTFRGKTSLADDETFEIGTIKGARRSRLNVQRRRTQRNRRNRKGRQFRKLTTRRR